MVTKRFEITVNDPITRMEFEWFEAMSIEHNVECAMTENGRILLVEGCETIYDLIKILAEHEFMHDIGLIKEIVDYEPQFKEMQITVEFE